MFLIAVIYGILRICISSGMAGLVTYGARRSGGYSSLSTTARRKMRLADEPLLMGAILLGTVDAFVMVIDSVRYQRAPGGYSLFLGYSMLAPLYWVILMILLLIGFMRIRPHLRRFAVIRRHLSDDDQWRFLLTDGGRLQDYHTELEQMRKILPPGAGYWITPLQVKIRVESESLPKDVLLERVRQDLLETRKAEALHWLLRWDDATPEALLLAGDCGDWRTCLSLLSPETPAELRIEIGQLMAASGDMFAASLPFIRDDHRRVAALHCRRREFQQAGQVLATDWEAKSLIHESTSGSMKSA